MTKPRTGMWRKGGRIYCVTSRDPAWTPKERPWNTFCDKRKYHHFADSWFDGSEFLSEEIANPTTWKPPVTYCCDNFERTQKKWVGKL